MTRRSYQQHCGLAAALDVVSQRWALLIVRDLKPGPRRFTDLFAGLPGVSTDVLTERLRELEEAGAVEQAQLTSPVPAKVYRLTSRGHELGRIVEELARWGAPLLPPAATSPLRRNGRWALQSYASRYTGGHSGELYHFVLDEQDEVTLRLGNDAATLRYGAPDEDPTASMACTTEDFFETWTGSSLLDGTSALQVEGDLGRLQELFDSMTSVLGARAALADS